MEKPNIILITVDALRSDILKAYNERNNNDFISEFSKQGTLFINSFSNAPITPYSLPSIMSGQYPGVYENEIRDPLPGTSWHPVKLSNQRKTIAEKLKDKGYHTVGLNDFNPFLIKGLGYERGFCYYHDFQTRSKKKMFRGKLIRLLRRSKKLKFLRGVLKLISFYFLDLSHTNSDKLTKTALNVIEKREQGDPFFLWMHFMDVHGPYSSHNKFTNRLKWFFLRSLFFFKPLENFSNKQIGVLKKLYINQYLYLSNNIIKKFIHDLEKKGINKNNTHFIFTADHGEAFLEHGKVEHTSDLYEELIKIPFIWVGPGISRKIVSENVSTVDICPTLDHLINGSGANEYDGKSLVDLLTEDSVEEKNRDIISLSIEDKNIFLISVRNEYEKYIAKITTKGEVKDFFIYDLKNDPNEKNKIKTHINGSLILEKKALEVIKKIKTQK